MPFWETCHGLMQIMGASTFGFDISALANFIKPCQQSVALVRGAESCQEGTGRGDGDDLHSWVDDVNMACCTQHGINVCRDGDTVPWLCEFVVARRERCSHTYTWKP